MREFFRGWRRKIGVMPLVVACAFMAGWVRSQALFDQIAARGNLFLSNGGCVVWDWKGWGGSDSSITDWYSNMATPFDEDWYLGSDGVRLPYWAIVIPLTLLSAHLLLSKPRPRKPPESTKPPDEAQVTHA
jgi:hypothetical protein